jgi:hypothetical protein
MPNSTARNPGNGLVTQTRAFVCASRPRVTLPVLWRTSATNRESTNLATGSMLMMVNTGGPYFNSGPNGSVGYCVPQFKRE